MTWRPNFTYFRKEEERPRFDFPPPDPTEGEELAQVLEDMGSVEWVGEYSATGDVDRSDVMLMSRQGGSFAVSKELLRRLIDDGRISWTTEMHPFRPGEKRRVYRVS